jgi:hypothetical protein
MDPPDELRHKQRYIRSLRSARALRFKFHEVDVSYLEAVFARGDRRLARALLAARDRGIRMDAWSECFDLDGWQEVFQQTGVDPDWYALRARAVGEVLPWDTIGLRIPASHLAKENRRAHTGCATASPPPNS